MSCILHIETSTEACSVAVSEDGLRKLDILLDAVEPDELSARLRQWLGQAERTA